MIRMCLRHVTHVRLASTSSSSIITSSSIRPISQNESKEFDIPPPPEPPTEIIQYADVKPEIVGGIIPWKMMPLMGKLMVPISFPIMYYINGLHEVFPWWASIALTTLTVRTFMLPVFIRSTKVTTKWQNIMPKEVKITQKIMEATAASDMFEVQHYRMKLKTLHKEHGVSQFQRTWPLLVQTPVFLSMFAILRTLAKEQETFKEGGLWWFKDLSVMDPTFMLPILTCSTLLLSLELGAETGGQGAVTKYARWGMRALPFGVFYVIYDFPAAMLCYWVVSNSFSLIQSIFLRNKTVRKKLNIPEAIRHDRTALGLDKPFSQMLKEWKEKSRGQRAPEEIRRLDRIAFEKAAIGPIQRTYRTDPTKDKPFGKSL